MYIDGLHGNDYLEREFFDYPNQVYTARIIVNTDIGSAPTLENIYTVKCDMWDGEEVALNFTITVVSTPTVTPTVTPWPTVTPTPWVTPPPPIDPSQVTLDISVDKTILPSNSGMVEVNLTVIGISESEIADIFIDALPDNDYVETEYYDPISRVYTAKLMVDTDTGPDEIHGNTYEIACWMEDGGIITQSFTIIILSASAPPPTPSVTPRVLG